MAIEVKVNEKVQSEFPKLMISENTGLIILACAKSGLEYKGFVILSDNNRIVGEYSSNWGCEFFTDYNGEITLKNK